MSLAIQLLILFFLIESCIARHIPDQDSTKNQDDDDDQDVCLSQIDYSKFFKHMIEGWLHEADERYPYGDDKGYLHRSFFLQGKARDYVQNWNKWKDHSGYPYGNLRNKVDVLWPHQVNTCPQIEATNLLTYLIHGLSRSYDYI